MKPHYGAHSQINAAVFILVFTSLRHRLPTNFQTRVILLILPYVGGRTFPFPVVSHLHRRFGTSDFFKSFLITVVLYSWVADQQKVLWPNSLELSCPFRRLCACFFFFFFLFPSPEICFPSLSNFKSPDHVMIMNLRSKSVWRDTSKSSNIHFVCGILDENQNFLKEQSFCDIPFLHNQQYFITHFKKLHAKISRRLWCNGYRRRKWP